MFYKIEGLQELEKDSFKRKLEKFRLFQKKVGKVLSKKS